MGPLEGVKILDLTSMISGPMGAMILADQGAEVIKVEPLAGEQLRHMASPHNGVNAPFYSCNRGKKSLAIDLKSEEGKDILLKLVKESDVFMQNFRPGTIDRMGFGYETLKKLIPILYIYRLVVLVIKGHMLIQEFMILLSKLYLVLQIFKQIESQALLRCSE